MPLDSINYLYGLLLLGYGWFYRFETFKFSLKTTSEMLLDWSILALYLSKLVVCGGLFSFLNLSGYNMTLTVVFLGEALLLIIFLVNFCGLECFSYPLIKL